MRNNLKEAELITADHRHFAAIEPEIGLPLILSLGGGAVFGLALPHMAVAWLSRRRIAKFLALLPEVVELMVRTVKSGLPIAEAISLAGHDLVDARARGGSSALHQSRWIGPSRSSWR